MENSLTYDSWKPSGAYPHAFYFFHCIYDEVVPFCNYESVKTAWGTNLFMGAPMNLDIIKWHVPCGAYFYLCKAFSCTKDIINQQWTPGEK